MTDSTTVPGAHPFHDEWSFQRSMSKPYPGNSVAGQPIAPDQPCFDCGIAFSEHQPDLIAAAPLTAEEMALYEAVIEHHDAELQREAADYDGERREARERLAAATIALRQALDAARVSSDDGEGASSEGERLPFAIGHIDGAHNHNPDPVCRICGGHLRLWPQTGVAPSEPGLDALRDLSEAAMALFEPMQHGSPSKPNKGHTVEAFCAECVRLRAKRTDAIRRALVKAGGMPSVAFRAARLGEDPSRG